MWIDYIALDNLQGQREVFKHFALKSANTYGFKTVYNHVKAENDKQFHLIQEVGVDEVISLLNKYEHSIDDNGRKEALISYIEERRDELTHWDIAVHKNYLGEKVPSQIRTFAKSSYKSDYVKTADGGGRILRPWEEAFGLTDEQYARAEKQKDKRQTARFYRMNRSRNRPLLVLKSFQNANGDKVKELVSEDVPAYAISFPKSSNHSPMSYVVNKVFMEDYFGEEDESDEIEEGHE